MARYKLLVYEQTPYWAPGFQQLFLQEGSIEVKSLQNLEEVPALVFPEEHVIVWTDFGADISQQSEQFSRLAQQFPNVMLCIVASPPVKRIQWVLREIGALTVLDQTISLSDAEQFCRRLWKSCTIS